MEGSPYRKFSISWKGAWFQGPNSGFLLARTWNVPLSRTRGSGSCLEAGGNYTGEWTSSGAGPVVWITGLDPAKDASSHGLSGISRYIVRKSGIKVVGTGDPEPGIQNLEAGIRNLEAGIWRRSSSVPGAWELFQSKLITYSI
ncbi:hypothetical protein F2Q70_00043809 [Brassica cretica]|uniref:Uncharacterized protein n=1 Tax=Brassica cretica TaxID=69181 RepID=A0A8S9IK67_BRACR|nr:hypothetical protein F2Q68_00025020 [Brassica cretica]KAF2594750.1 hypothetical protein F2Q70_00043809 [Brassica cretica]